jgi:hypothetical protein
MRDNLRNGTRSVFRYKKLGQRHADYIISKVVKVLPRFLNASLPPSVFKKKLKLWLKEDHMRNYCSQLINKYIWEIIQYR